MGKIMRPRTSFPQRVLAFYFSGKRFLRLQKPFTVILGPVFSRSRCRIEIDLTYECDLKCKSCNRSCGHARTDEQMTVKQIEKFIRESIENEMVWENINLVGGEPTLHPDLLRIIDVLSEYKEKHCLGLKIALTTHGAGERVDRVLCRIPQHVEVKNSRKDILGTAYHVDFNDAPSDHWYNAFADYSNGCFIPSFCGMGLTPYGYYCCAVAGSIDRVFGFDGGRKRLPLGEDTMKDQMRVFCRFCGHSIVNKISHKGKITRSWQKAYAKYHEHKPKLTFF